MWVCLFGGGAIRRYDPDGALTAELALPVAHPTCPAFGGSALRTLFITTTRHRLSADQRAAQPLAGALLSMQPGVPGQPTNHFAG